MDHTEAIVELKKFSDVSFTDRIIPLINKKAKKNLETIGGLETAVRNVKGYTLTFNTPTDLFYFNFIKKFNLTIFTNYIIMKTFSKTFSDFCLNYLANQF